MEERKYYVYFHKLNNTDLVDDIFYIGKGCGNRCYSFRNRNKYWHNKVSKNGKFYVEKIAENLTQDEAFDLEEFYISIYGQWHNNGLLVNMTDGGDGVRGFSFTKEHRDKISKALKGRKGKPLTEEVKLKISLAKSGIKHHPDIIKKRSEKLIGRYKDVGYTIDMYTLDNLFIGNYKCVTEIVKKYNLKSIRGNIFGCLNGFRKNAGGYIFMKNVKQM